MQPVKKKKTKTSTPRCDEDIPENVYDVSAFFDTECRQGKPEPDEPGEETFRELLFFDFECRQENGNHQPNLCILHNEPRDEWIFPGDNTQDEFCEWLFSIEHANCTVIL